VRKSERDRWVEVTQELQRLARVPISPEFDLGRDWDEAPVKPRRPSFRSKDIASVYDAYHVSRARQFVVNQFLGRDYADVGVIRRSKLWDRTEFDAVDYGSREAALAAARFARDEMLAADPTARVLTYAVCANGLSLFVS
jgi:hypothetical protein